VADYTLKNLKEIEDQAPKFGLAPNLEARFARTPLETEQLGISYQRLAPDFRIPFGHRHGEQEEIYVVLSGSARLKLDEEVVELKQWDVVRVAKDTMRNFEAGPEGAEILAIGAGESGIGDAKMAQGWWPA
jgi:mannose-6-phosphate isomerase-like protein (cupin superfamily)